MKKITCYLFLVFFLIVFFPRFNYAGVESFEDDARTKRLGLGHKERDSEEVNREKLLRDIELGNIERIRLFLLNTLAGGKNINFIVDGLNPFVHAATFNNIDIVKFFLNEAIVDINVQDELGNTALIKASEMGNLEIIDYLITEGADINHQNKQGLTAAMVATEKNNFYVIKYLLEKNIDLTKTDYTGRTLQEIAENSRDKRIRKLLN